MATDLQLFPSRVPIVNKDGTGTPEFLRALGTLGRVVTGTEPASAGVDPAVSGLLVPSFSMLPVASGGPVSRRWEYAATNPNTWNTRSGMMTFKGKFTCNSYFAANPSAHFVVGLRVDTAVIAVQPRFHGIACGNLSGAAEGCPHWPAMQIESRATGLDPGGALRMLVPNAWSPQSRTILDGIEYDLLIQSKLVASDRRTVRFVLSVHNAAVSAAGDKVYDILVDTGDVLDPNTYLDMTQQGLVFASVFEDNLVPWSIDWGDMTVTWSDAPDVVTDATARVSRYGSDFEGNVNFIGNGRRIKIVCNGATVPNWTLFQSQTANTATYVGAIPEGSATASALIAANNSSPVNFSYASLGMNGARAELTTLNLGTVPAPPPLDVKIGTTTIATFDTAGGTRGILINNAGGGGSAGTWTRFQSDTTNGNSTVVVVPNGTATASNFLATNTPTLSGAYGYASWGMNGANAELTTYGINGGANPPINVSIGGTQVAAFDATKQTLLKDLLFSGNTLNVLLNNAGGGASAGNWTRFKTSSANGNTSVLAVPDGAATAANFIATNAQSQAGAYGYASLGMNGANAELTTLGVNGGGTPPLHLVIGATTHIVDGTGLTISGASQTIGQASTRLTGLNNVGGANATALTTAAQNLETYCTANNIANTVNAALAGGANVGQVIELVLISAYAMISGLVADNNARKIS